MKTLCIIPPLRLWSYLRRLIFEDDKIFSQNSFTHFIIIIINNIHIMEIGEMIRKKEKEFIYAHIIIMKVIGKMTR